jgi:hypothetical protein
VLTPHTTNHCGCRGNKAAQQAAAAAAAWQYILDGPPDGPADGFDATAEASSAVQSLLQADIVLTTYDVLQQASAVGVWLGLGGVMGCHAVKYRCRLLHRLIHRHTHRHTAATATISAGGPLFWQQLGAPGLPAPQEALRGARVTPVAGEGVRQLVAVAGSRASLSAPSSQISSLGDLSVVGA